MMIKSNLMLLSAMLDLLSACTPTQTSTVQKQVGYLKPTISQAELNNSANYKRYYYTCRNFETGSESYLSTYFPLSRESRLQENFGIYFQLDGGKAEPFDHIENKMLNARGTRFEVIYRAYYPINGANVELVANQYSSDYYKIRNGMRTAWLSCREG